MPKRILREPVGRPVPPPNLLAQPSVEGPLVKIGKFAAIPEITQFRAGMGLQSGVLTDADHRRWSQIERWALKAVAEKALLGTPAGEKLHRCHRYRLGAQVEVWRDPLRGTASYRQLETCHSVWTCPLCSAKIGERRRVELVEGVSRHRAAGGEILFETTTFRHGLGDVLPEILEKFRQAQRWMTARRDYKAFKQRFGIMGWVRALEVTHGRNGWHPHGHALVFLKRRLSAAEFELASYEYGRLWARACVRMGLPEPKAGIGYHLKRALVSTEELVAEYVAKFGYQPATDPHWTAAHELTRSQAKHGRLHGRSPWDLLRSDLVEEDPQALALFREYAEAFRGRSQLRWTPGLRAALRMGVEVSDQELAETSSEDENELFVSLDAACWRRIVRAGMRRQILEVAGAGDLDGLLQVIEECPVVEDVHDVDWCDPHYRGRQPRARRGERGRQRHRISVVQFPPSMPPL